MLRRSLLQCILVSLCFFSLNSNAVAAAEHGSSDEAVAMVKKAVAFVKDKGKDAFLAAVPDAKGPFIDRDLYLSVYDFNGVVLAHGVNPKLVGKSVLTLNDMDGKFFIKDILAKAKASGKGTEDYKWPNPLTKDFQMKSAYFEVVDNLVISCGFYKY